MLARPTPAICKHAIWIYGALVGLALKEAIATVAPHMLAFATEPDVLYAEVIRLFVFGLMTIRFYLGAAHVFENLHSPALSAKDGYADLPEDDQQALRRASRQVGVDFLCGVLHFTIFSVWSMTLELHAPYGSATAHSIHEGAFRWVLAFILVFDLFWLAARPGPHARELKFWTFVNTASLVMGTALFSWLTMVRHWGSVDAETALLWPLAGICLADITGHTMGTSSFIQIGVRTLSSVARLATRWSAALSELHGKSSTSRG